MAAVRAAELKEIVMPREFIRTSEPYYLHLDKDGSTYSKYFPGNRLDTEIAWPKDLDKSAMYVDGIDLRWYPEQEIQVGVGVFHMTTHEQYFEVLQDGDTTVHVHKLTQYATLDRRWQIQQLIKHARRARNIVYGADE
jgi:hypothetical protein